MVPRDAPGVTVHDDWDAMGMRSSGSCSRRSRTLRSKAGAGPGAPAGILSAEFLELFLNSGPAHTAAALGVARRATSSRSRASQEADEESRSRDSPFVQERAAENSIDLAAARPSSRRALGMIDEYEEDHPNERGRMAEVTPVFVEVQRAKTFVTAAAVRILDRALAMSGGAGYLSANPLAPLPRRAGWGFHAPAGHAPGDGVPGRPHARVAPNPVLIPPDPTGADEGPALFPGGLLRSNRPPGPLSAGRGEGIGRIRPRAQHGGGDRDHIARSSSGRLQIRFRNGAAGMR